MIMSVALALLVLPLAVSAEWSINSVSGYGLPGEGYNIGDILMRLLQWVLGIFGILAVLAFVISGIMYLTASGDADQIKRAKTAMIWSIVGVVVGLGGVVIIQTIESALSGTLFIF